MFVTLLHKNHWTKNYKTLGFYRLYIRIGHKILFVAIINVKRQKIRVESLIIIFYTFAHIKYNNFVMLSMKITFLYFN